MRIGRSSHRRCSVRKGVLGNFEKFTGNHLCQSLFLNKVAGLRPATLLKMKLWHKCFPVSFAKFLRIPFSHNTCGRLLLDRIKRNWQNELRMCLTSKYRNKLISDMGIKFLNFFSSFVQAHLLFFSYYNV